MTHRPGGQGLARAIKRKAVPALLHKKIDASGSSDKWRRLHDVETENINIYIILQEAEMELIEEGEEEKQWALLYNTQQKLKLGQAVEFSEKNWLFLIKKSAPRPAINPAYFKAWGVMVN